MSGGEMNGFKVMDCFSEEFLKRWKPWIECDVLSVCVWAMCQVFGGFERDEWGTKGRPEHKGCKEKTLFLGALTLCCETK